ncbi:EF-hand domain-containing protein [Zavarzinella formosa]|uniref:EF-hand domain-containing protein n=1 Tax=Zavarzinella formosa TaxID=360055 RepID=UPI0003667390|nr:EF-hand domain-containing protein [Zavarzinella formosa]
MRAVLVVFASFGLVAAATGADGVDLLLPARVRIEATSDGETVEARWSAFLDRLFSHFDRNADDSLDAKEAENVFSLPLPGKKSIAADFAKMDADKNSKISRAEWRAFYRAAGFAPVVSHIVPPTPEQRTTSEILFRRLDRDGDGKLSKDELAKAPVLLKQLDADENESITIAEILAVGIPADLPTDPENVRANPLDASAVVLGRFQVKRPAVGPVKITAVSDKPEFVIDQSTESTVFFRWPTGTGRLGPATQDPVAQLREAKGYCRSAYETARGSKPLVEWKAIEDDPAHQVVRMIFPAADRDGNGQLTTVELDQFLDLIEAGATCQITIEAVDHGRNLFVLLDQNGDGRLGFQELANAGKIIHEGATRLTIPRTVRMTAKAGCGESTFGPVRIASPKPVTAEKPPAKFGGPAWFIAMDTNQDGVVSRREFIGPPAAFDRLDIDHDGTITRKEAEAAGKKP